MAFENVFDNDARNELYDYDKFLYQEGNQGFDIPLFKGCRFFALPPRVKHSIHSCQKTSVREAHRWSFYYPKSGKYAFLLSESGKGTSRNAPGNVNFLQEEHS